MNLILFEKDEIRQSLPGYDPRVKHIRRTLKYAEGDIFDAAIVNGEIGKAKILVLDKSQMVIDFTPRKNQERSLFR